MKAFKLLMVLAALFTAGLVQAGELKVSETYIEYGTVKEGPPIVKTIVLTNAGAEQLTISKVVAS